MDGIQERRAMWTEELSSAAYFLLPLLPFQSLEGGYGGLSTHCWVGGEATQLSSASFTHLPSQFLGR